MLSVTKVPQRLLDRLDLRSALEAELAFNSDLLPKQISDQAAAKDSDAHEMVIRQTLVTEDIATEAPVVTAQKSRFGRRPVPALTLPQRVTYRAVVQLLDEWLAPQRGETDYDDLQEGPARTEANYVVITDLAHYYVTLPVPALQRELMARSGEWQSVQWLGDFLTGLSPTRGGLPQGNYASDRLGDTYADTLARRLRRRGIDCWRYVDDFRLATTTYTQAVDALEVFSEEARGMGLLVNNSKTWITSMSRYRDRLDTPRKAFTEAWQHQRDKLTFVSPYDMSEFPPNDVEVMKEVALEELESWAQVADKLKTNQSENREERLDLARVMRVLAVTKAEQALVHVPKLLVVEPQLMSRIARYLASLVEENRESVMDMLASAVSDPDLTLTAWQAIWLVDLLADWLGDSPSAATLKKWTSEKFLHGPGVLKAFAGWASAAQGTMTQTQWQDWSTDARGPFEQCYVQAVLGAIDPAADAKSSRALDEDLMIKWGQNFALTH